MNPDRLLFLFMHGGKKCWHEEWETISAGHFRNIRYFHKCKKCGRTAPVKKVHSHPDFSLPSHRDEFFTWLCRENLEMFGEFFWWSYRKSGIDLSPYHVAWLFFSDPARPRDLMAEWLRLPETVERFGVIKRERVPLTLYCADFDSDNDAYSAEVKTYAEWAKSIQFGRLLDGQEHNELPWKK